ncbi:DUF1289 domain-containing protein [Xanthobacter sp. TB0139]|uniref:DUF1289 domain-containing protein n=1 Tax=Xanthobacter sp. TB0139 TaxID=3459178 RepID=UPI0040391BA4
MPSSGAYAPETVESPCLNICELTDDRTMCTACGRMLMEIANWSSFSPEERSRIMAELPARLARLKAEQAAEKASAQ